MQIDTWNRDEMSLTGGPFVPGPYPQKSGDPKWPSGNLAPVNGSDAGESDVAQHVLWLLMVLPLAGVL